MRKKGKLVVFLNFKKAFPTCGYLAEYLQLHECRLYIEKPFFILGGHVCSDVLIYLIFFTPIVIYDKTRAVADHMLIYTYISVFITFFVSFKITKKL